MDEYGGTWTNMLVPLHFDINDSVFSVSSVLKSF